MSERRSAPEAYAALGGLTLIWSYTWVVVKIATHDASPFFLAAFRPGAGAVMLFAAIALRRTPLRPTPLRDTIIYGLLQTTGFTLLQTVAVALGGAGKTVLLVYTMPFWLVLLARPLLGEPITRRRQVALALAAAGLGFAIVPLDARTLPSDLLAVASGIFWAASAVWAKRMQDRAPANLLALTAWQMLWGTIPLVAVAALVPERVVWTASLVGSLAFMSIAAQALGWLLWLFALDRLPAGVAGIASLAIPVLGVALAWLQLGEVPSVTELIGTAFIVAALAVNAAPGVRRAAPSAPRGAPEAR